MQLRHRLNVIWLAAILAAIGSQRDGFASERLLGLSAASVAVASAPAQPNIVLILADDLGWADLGCYGSTQHRTPRIDRLAAEGLRLTNAYAAQSICSASRAALFTGRAPARLQLTDFIPGRPIMDSQRLLRPAIRDHLPLSEHTLAELLRAAGYRSACVGKWHLGGSEHGPLEQGFDEAYDPSDPADPSSPDGGKNEHALTRRAIDFVERHRDRPFFLLLAHHTPHIPLAASPEQIAKYSGTPHPIYAAMMESLDDSVGQLLDRLEALNLSQDTLVLFTSDNGGLSVVEGVATPATSNAPLRGGKGSLYEGGIRVPLIARWPARVKAGVVSNAPVVNFDLAPTLLSLCDAASTDRIGAAFDGVSLVSLLTAGEAPTERSLYWHYPHYSNQRGEPAGAVRWGDWKLIEFFDGERVELYHLPSDPSETQNLATSEPARVREFRRKLADWRASVGAAMPTLNPAYDPDAVWTTVGQRDDGIVLLHASVAEVHGQSLRYEPQPHKNTLGYWTRLEDSCRWDFLLDQPARYSLSVLQGCGVGSGGAEVELEIFSAQHPSDKQTLVHVVKDTGHFQNFVSLEVGEVDLPRSGRYTLHVRPRSKPGVAVMDLREVKLTPRR